MDLFGNEESFVFASIASPGSDDTTRVASSPTGPVIAIHGLMPNMASWNIPRME
jgi:hypothetical protein